MRAASSALLVVALLCASACTHTQALVITGESLDALGETFVATAEVMDAGVEAGRITQAQYSAWATFGVRFQGSFAAAVRLWTTAREIGDAVVEGQMQELLAKLAGELAEYVALARAIAHPDGGA